MTSVFTSQYSLCTYLFIVHSWY